MDTSDKPLFHFRSRIDRALTLSSLGFAAATIVIMHVVLSITLWVSILGAYAVMALWVSLENRLAFRRTMDSGHGSLAPVSNGSHRGRVERPRRPGAGTPIAS
jgi:hypothetical protein